MTVDCRRPSHTDHEFGQHARSSRERRVLTAVVITTVVMFAEVVVGWLSGSMALLADGVHMGTHALALSIALGAYVVARRYAADRRFSFGTGKVQELAGFASAILLGATAVAIAIEAAQRLIAPQLIDYSQAIVAACIGLAANVASYIALRGPTHDRAHNHNHNHDHDEGHGHHHSDDSDSNLKGAILHVLADTLTSIGAIVALVAGMNWGWSWLDPVVAMAAAVVISWWAVGLMRATSRILLDREAPEEVRRAVRTSLESHGDSSVVDLHVWSIAPGMHTVVASVVTHGNQQPQDYRIALERELDVIHPVIEVQRCTVHDRAPERNHLASAM